MKLGPFLVTDGGKLSFRAPEAEARFSFVWRKRCFAIRLHDGRLDSAVPIGRVPSSSAGAERRATALPMLRALSQQFPARWRLSLLPDHRIQLEIAQDLAWPATAAALFTPLFGLVMQVAPVLDLMEEAGLA
jgi:hypothetical protein